MAFLFTSVLLMAFIGTVTTQHFSDIHTNLFSDPEPIKHTQQLLSNTYTDVLVKTTNSPLSSDNASFSGLPPTNGEPRGDSNIEVSHTPTSQLSTSAGALPTKQEHVSSLYTAMTLGSEMPRKEIIKSMESASQTQTASQVSIDIEANITEEPDVLSTGDTSKYQSSSQSILVLKETIHHSLVTVTPSPTSLSKPTRDTQQVLSKYAVVQSQSTTTVSLQSDLLQPSHQTSTADPNGDENMANSTVTKADITQRNKPGLFPPSSSPTPPLLRFVSEVKVSKKKGNGSTSMAIIPPPSVLPGSSPGPASKPCEEGSGGCVFPDSQESVDKSFGANSTLSIQWVDLHNTLSFTWDLHVFGSAALFILLCAGGALGLVLSPATCCPLRGALVFSNVLLLLVGALQGIHFLIDPYSSRLILPRAAIRALITLPLSFLLWAQAAMVSLILKVTKLELDLVPLASLRLPSLIVLAVLQSTLLLGADLMSPALSPVVPMVLQTITLLAGLTLCLAFLLLVLPRVAHDQHECGKSEEWWPLQTFGCILTICALLGTLCCLLHIHTCLWLYGLLGNWRQFSWTWWLTVFWAHLLELVWGFCLLLLASWIFWRPCTGMRATAERATADIGQLSSPCQTDLISHPHTCWAKIVQSLKGHPSRNSEGMAGIGFSGTRESTGEAEVSIEHPDLDISEIQAKDRMYSQHQSQRFERMEAKGFLLRQQTQDHNVALSKSSSLNCGDRESSVSLYDFDLRPPSPIDLSRSIDKALHREHLLHGMSLFHPQVPLSPSPELDRPRTWLRCNSDPQLTLSGSSGTILTESSAQLDRVVNSLVPSRQVTAPPTPSHWGPYWCVEQQVPSSISCPVSLQPLNHSMESVNLVGGEDTRPYVTPNTNLADSELDSSAVVKRMLVVSHLETTASMSSDIIEL